MQNLLLLTVAIIVSAASVPLQAAVKLFVLAGQSNMEGHAQEGQLKRLLCAVEEYDLADDEHNCFSEFDDSEERLFQTVSDFYWNGERFAFNYTESEARTEAQALNNSQVLRADLLSPLNAVQTMSYQYSRQSDGTTTLQRVPAGDLTVGFGNGNNKYGPELSLGHVLHQAYPNDVIVFVKVVQGGSDLHEQWRSPSAEQRLGNSEKESLYPKMVRHVRFVLDNPAAYFPEFPGLPGQDIELAGLFWFQGFNDSVGPEEFAENYEQNLTDLFNDFRAEFDAPNLPIVIGQSHNDGAKGLIVQEAQDNVAQTLEHVSIIPTTDLSSYFHYDSGSHIIIGERLGKSFLENNPQAEEIKPILHLPRLTGDQDLSEFNNVINVRESDGESRGFPDLALKTIDIELEKIPLVGGYSISFKLQPNAEYSGLIYADDHVSIFQDGLYLRSVFDPGSSSGPDELRNPTKLKLRSCNHFAVIIERRSHRNYCNGVMAGNSPGLDPRQAVGAARTLGPWPGELWDMRVYDSALDESAVLDLAELCMQGPVADPPNSEFPLPLCGPYICLWGNDDTDLSEERFEYYLYAQDKTYRHNIFTVGMYPTGRLDEYVLNELAGGRNLALHPGIVTTFVKNWSFSNPLKRENGNFWVHENFHSFQGQMQGFTNIRANKFFLEMSAEWGSDAFFPGVTSTLLGYYSLNPHLPLWADQNVPLEEIGWKAEGHGGHQYGAYVFFSYVTNHYTNKAMIGQMFNNVRSRTEPAALLYDILLDEGFQMEEVFMEFASRVVTFDYENGQYYLDSENRSWNRLQNAFDGAVNRKIAATYEGVGTNGDWHAPSTEVRPGSWAYNIYQVNADESRNYSVAFRSPADNPEHTDFRAKVVVHDPEDTDFPGQRKYYELELERNPNTGEFDGEVTVPANEGDIVYLVVATVPQVFNGFDTYDYEYLIEKADKVSTSVTLNDNTVNAGGSFLLQNVPNPADQETEFSYQLERPAHVNLELFELVSGRKVADLDNGWKQLLTNSVRYDAQDLPAGVYLYSLTVDGQLVAVRSLMVGSR